MNPTNGKFETVIFDLDGTLLDSLSDIAIAANRVLEKNGYRPHSIDDYKFLVGDGVRVLFERAIPEPDCQSSEVIEGCVAGFHSEYDHQWNQTSEPYAGIPELLKNLQVRAVCLAILSNKPHAFTTACVEHFFAQNSWGAVLGNQAGIPRKPDPAGVHEILAQVDGSANRTLYVGDTNTDMKTATSSGCVAVGVTWGFRSEAELRDAGAQHIIHEPNELLDLLEPDAAL